MDWLPKFSFVHNPWIPYAIAAFGVLFVLSLLSYRGSPLTIWKRVFGIAARMLGIGLLLFCILEPMASLERPKPQANSVAILVDNSRSLQALAHSSALGVASQSPESSPLLPWLVDDADWLLDLSKDFRVRKYVFDQSLAPVESLTSRTGTGNASSLYYALRNIEERYRGEPLAAIIVVSDGHATDAPERAINTANALKLPTPIFPVQMDMTDRADDLRLDHVGVRVSEFETAPTTIQATLSHRGLEGEEAIVELRDHAGGLVKQESLKLSAGAKPQGVTFRFRPDASGITDYAIHARLASEPNAAEGESVYPTATRKPRELTYGNNHRIVSVDRGIGPYRVLYIAGRANWEFKFLRRALDEDAEIKLTSLIRIARKQPKFSFRNSQLESTNPLFRGFEDVSEEEKEQYNEPVFARLGVTDSSELKKGFPKDSEELYAYSAVILDDIEPDFFTLDQQQMLRQFVSVRGGALLALGGQESMRGKTFRDSILGQLLPVYGDTVPPDMVTPQGVDEIRVPPVRFLLSREGWLQPWLRLFERESEEKSRLQEMPPFQVWNRTSQFKPGTRVLVEGMLEDEENVPLLLMQRFGRGSSAAFMIGDFWRWGLIHDGPEASPIYQAWRQMVRALIADVPKQHVARIEVSPASPRIARIKIEVRGQDFQVIDNAVVDLTITDPSGETVRSIAVPSASRAGEYECEMVMTETGFYRATAAIRSSDGSDLGDVVAGCVYEPEVAEMAEIGLDRERLKALAQGSGGRLLTPSELGRLAEVLPPDKVPVTEMQTFPLWHQPWIVMTALISLILEWRLRRRNGLA